MAAVASPDYQQQCVDLEKQELESGNTACSATQYSQLLALYLLNKDLCNAKFLWKRIPPAVKQGCTELSSIWAVGEKMWKKDYPGLYQALSKEWSEPVSAIMAAVTESVRNQALRLVRTAYSSINSAHFATFIGMSEEQAIEAAQREGWEVDTQNKIITPKKLDTPAPPTILSDQHLSVLTDYVTFMEN